MRSRKYDATLDKIYQAMLQMARRRGHPAPGILASFYLDVFVFRTKAMKAEFVYELKLAEPNTFSDNWREEQKKWGFLSWTVTQVGSRPKVDYRVGPKLIGHINKALLSVDQVVTRTDFDSLAQRVEALENAMDVLIEKADPPTTDEKRAHYTANPERLLLVKHA